MIKRIISVSLVLWMMLSLCAPVFSAYIASVSEAIEADEVKLDWFVKDGWKDVSGVNGVHVRNTGSSHIIYVNSDDTEDPMKVSYTPDKPLDLSKYNELIFQITLSKGENCSFEITYYYDGGIFSHKASNESESRILIYFPLPAEGKGAIERIELSVENTEKRLNYFAIEEIFADSHRTYSYAERFASRSVVAVDGNAVYTDDYVEITPDENGAHIECTLIGNYEKNPAMVVAEVYSPTVGIMTLENEVDGSLQTTALYSGTAKYSFMIPELEEKIKIGFSESDMSNSSAIRFISLKIIPMPDKVEKPLGSIESCIYENGKIKVKGTVLSEAAVKYIGAKLQLYKVPYDYIAEGELGEPEAEMDISTVFELSTEAGDDFSQSRYLVAIKTKTQVVPLTTPVFAVSRASLNPIGQECRVGIHNVGTTAAFESEADDVVIDVEFGKLFVSSNTSSAVRFAYRDSVYYFSRDYVNDILSDINFFVSTGARVYLQTKTVGEDVIEFSCNNIASVNKMCAAAEYMGETFGKITGVIVFSDFDYTVNTADGAKEAALLLGMFASSFRRVNENSDIIISAGSDASFTASLTAYYMGMYGIEDIGLVYKCRDAENCISGIRATLDSATALSAPFRRSLVIWENDSDISNPDVFANLYDNASKSDISGIVLSASVGLTTDAVCEYFTGVHGDGYVSYEFECSSEETRYRGEYSLWDFTDAYDIFGWIAGGNCSDPETVRSSFNDVRAMKTVVTPSKGEEGILACWLEGTTDLSVADAMKMDFYIDANTGEAMPVTVVLGGNGVKAEYKSQVYYGANTVYADLGLFSEANRIEYVAVIFDIDKAATVEIYDISLVSSQLAGQELKAEINPATEDNKDMASIYIFAGAIISATIVIFAILSKKTVIK